MWRNESVTPVPGSPQHFSERFYWYMINCDIWWRTEHLAGKLLGCKLLPGTRSLIWKIWEHGSAWLSLPSVSKRKQFLPFLLPLSPTVYKPICLIAYGVRSLYRRAPLLGPPHCSCQSQPHSNNLHFKTPGSISTPLSHLPPQFNHSCISCYYCSSIWVFFSAPPSCVQSSPSFFKSLPLLSH